MDFVDGSLLKDALEQIEKGADQIRYLEMSGNSYGVDFMAEFS